MTTCTCVAPPPAGPMGCRPMNLHYLLNLSFAIWAPYSSLGRTKVLYVAFLVFLGKKVKFPRKKPKVTVALDETCADPESFADGVQL